MISQALIEFRAARGLSQQRLAEMIGVTAMAVSNWERGKKRPRPTSMVKIAAVLGGEKTKEAPQ